MTAKHRLLLAAAPFVIAVAPLAAQDAPIVKPGAPGQQAERLSARDATLLATQGYTPADVAFMQ
ncbi:MAG: hypothetical protein WA948_01685, partial [Pontixanthobacter sp.]